jgi:drug/metabolite transporter (DMT)-like permease
MGDGLGVLIAIASSALGGTAAAITRYFVSNADPITLAILRWCIGITCVLPTALILRVKMPSRRDFLPIAAVPAGNLIRLVREAESRNASVS